MSTYPHPTGLVSIKNAFRNELLRVGQMQGRNSNSEALVAEGLWEITTCINGNCQIRHATTGDILILDNRRSDCNSLFRVATSSRQTLQWKIWGQSRDHFFITVAEPTSGCFGNPLCMQGSWEDGSVQTLVDDSLWCRYPWDVSFDRTAILDGEEHSWHTDAPWYLWKIEPISWSAATVQSVLSAQHSLMEAVQPSNQQLHTELSELVSRMTRSFSEDIRIRERSTAITQVLQEVAGGQQDIRNRLEVAEGSQHQLQATVETLSATLEQRGRQEVGSTPATPAPSNVQQGARPRASEVIKIKVQGTIPNRYYRILLEGGYNWSSLLQMVKDVTGVSSPQVTYTDDEGDMCILNEGTFDDFHTLSHLSAITRLSVAETEASQMVSMAEVANTESSTQPAPDDSAQEESLLQDKEQSLEPALSEDSFVVVGEGSDTARKDGESRTGHCKCFVNSSLVKMSDGSFKLARNLRYNDAVLGSGNQALRVVSAFRHPVEKVQLATIRTALTEIIVSVDHRIQVERDDGTHDDKLARDLRLGDKVFCGSKTAKVTKLMYEEQRTELTEVRFTPDEAVETFKLQFGVFTKGSPNLIYRGMGNFEFQESGTSEASQRASSEPPPFRSMY